MKKILNILSVVALVGSTAATVVACATVEVSSKNIALVTDAGSINDKSFNQSAWEAVEEFMKLEEEEGYTRQSFEPIDPNDILNKYTSAANSGNGTVVAPGFAHANPIKEYSKQNNDIFKQQHYIWLDGNDRDLASIDNTNVAKIVFYAAISGFYAGISSALFLNKEVPEGDLKTSGWLGGDSQGVTDFIAGYYSAIRFFNANKDDESMTGLYNEAFGEAPVAALREVQFVNPDSGARIDNHAAGEVPTGLGKSIEWVTSFHAGDGKALAKKGVENGVNAMMPVAGPQSQDWLTEIEDKEGFYAVGVDTDMSQQYEGEESTFITSALKDLKGATVDTLNAIHNKDKDEESKAEYNKYFTNNKTIEDASWSDIAANADYANLDVAVKDFFTKEGSPVQPQAIQDWFEEALAKVEAGAGVWLSGEIMKTTPVWE
ncbi:BMP family ABC transporter substrate-binding protein [Spiroplasma endosymbiont of Anurida maritima]|uniref:BMP family ABC transporter substrate-binding protein n=1 Tax=Spiroplasma endosymbiont of Anurida maritima TaxID=2967972 RepID=UPI0036D2ACDE